MGSAMANNLLASGHDLKVWNRTPGRADALVNAGAKLVDTPAQAAQGDVVMTMLADDRAVEAIVYGEDGIAESPALHVGHSTISIALADRLASNRSGGGYVSAPVIGRPAAADAAQLFLLAAGAEGAISQCMPLFDAVGQRVFHMGQTPSAANRAKLAANFMIMTSIEAMAEAMAFAEAGGIEARKLLDMLTGTLFGAPIFTLYGEVIVEDRFRPAGFPAPLGLKDMNLVDAAANSDRLPMPFLGIVRDHLRSAIANEGEDIDWAGVALAVRRAGGP